MLSCSTSINRRTAQRPCICLCLINKPFLVAGGVFFDGTLMHGDSSGSRSSLANHKQRRHALCPNVCAVTVSTCRPKSLLLALRRGVYETYLHVLRRGQHVAGCLRRQRCVFEVATLASSIPTSASVRANTQCFELRANFFLQDRPRPLIYQHILHILSLHIRSRFCGRKFLQKKSLCHTANLKNVMEVLTRLVALTLAFSKIFTVVMTIERRPHTATQPSPTHSSAVVFVCTTCLSRCWTTLGWEV